MKILLTGFGPFGIHAVNSSQAIVEAVAQRRALLGLPDLVTALLPVEFDAAGGHIRHLLRETRPDVCLCLGVHDGAMIRLEKIAWNRDDPTLCDNAGQTGCLGPIVTESPAFYTATLPIARFLEILAQGGVPASLSDDAGGYVCNHVFYLACHEIAASGLPTRCGFVHVPPIDGLGSLPGLPFEVLLAAVESILGELREDAAAGMRA